MFVKMKRYQGKSAKYLMSSLGSGLGLIMVLGSNQIAGVAQNSTQNSTITQAKVSEILEGNQVFIQSRQAKVNDVAQLRQQIRTGQARVEVEFNNKAIARLGRNSTLIVGQCGAQVQRGSVLVNGTASACTSTISAAVRGTTYAVEVTEDGEEQIKVLEGEVEVTNLREPGQRSYTATGGQALQVRRGRILAEARPLSQREFETVLTGPLVRGYRGELRSVDRIERVFKRLYPSATFPLRRAALNPLRGHFSLAILQNRPQLSQVIARISLKSRRANGFLEERFVGDYLYPINQRAKFIRGLNPGDHMVVRLYDLQNQLIGYSEFELLADHAAASIVLPDRSSAYGTVRTVIGLDVDQNGEIDRGETAYDYFSQLDYATNRQVADTRVTFLTSDRDLDLSLFNPAGLLYPSRSFLYPGTLAVANRTIAVFNPDLEPTLTSAPRQLTPLISIDPRGRSTYEVTRQILRFKR